MPTLKTVRVKKWKVLVYQDHVATPNEYVVYATSEWNARVLAFALDGGFPYTMTTMEECHAELAMEYTKVLAST
jgi:hypothetical protein